MKCYGCESFEIVFPKYDYQEGLARCNKYGVVCDFVSGQQLKRLTCENAQEVARKGADNGKSDL